MLPNYFDKIYYINLDKHKDRLKHTLLQISKTSLKTHAKRFSAVNGSTIDINNIDNLIITDNARKDILSGVQRTFGISLTFGALGCALSHKQIFEECEASNKPFLIFEDDFTIDHNFDNDLINVLNNIDSNYHILYLGFHNIPSAKTESINDYISKPVGLTCGTYGYIISPPGAKLLLKYVFPMDCQIDSMMSKNLHRMNSYCSKKTLVHMPQNFESNTQRDISCINIHSDDWMRLFT
jgi:GR25 family glycosyltransferase involved in LPS biosynthesis